ncbi:MAG: hypothetical protein ACKVX7_20005 [Planctomycetota bacterium]
MKISIVVFSSIECAFILLAALVGCGSTPPRAVRVPDPAEQPQPVFVGAPSLFETQIPHVSKLALCGEYLLTRHDSKFDGCVLVTRARTGDVAYEFRALDFQQLGSRALIFTERISEFDGRTGEIRDLGSCPLTSEWGTIVVSPDRKIAAYSARKLGSLRSTHTAQPTSVVTIPGGASIAEVQPFKYRNYPLAFTPDGKFLLLGGTNARGNRKYRLGSEVLLWSVDHHQILERRLPSCLSVVGQLVVGDDESGSLIVLDNKTSITLIEFATGKRILTREHGLWYSRVATDEQNGVLAYAAKDAIVLLDLKRGNEYGIALEFDYVYSLALDVEVGLLAVAIGVPRSGRPVVFDRRQVVFDISGLGLSPD